MGVTPLKQSGKLKYRAFINVDGKQKYLGVFSSDRDAAIAYNEAAVKHHGEFANLNKINPDPLVMIAEFDEYVDAIIIQ